MGVHSKHIVAKIHSRLQGFITNSSKAINILHCYNTRNSQAYYLSYCGTNTKKFWVFFFKDLSFFKFMSSFKKILKIKLISTYKKTIINLFYLWLYTIFFFCLKQLQLIKFKEAYYLSKSTTVSIRSPLHFFSPLTLYFLYCISIIVSHVNK